MKPLHGSSHETRPSLLARLRSSDDAQSWQEFYKIYGGLIRFFAEKAGLTADEAEEVVQETAIGVARRLPEFTYDPKVCRFKSWLLNLARWRIQDQIRKRRPVGVQALACPPEQSLPVTLKRELQRTNPASTAEMDRIPDPNAPEFGTEWDAAWEKNLLNLALEKIRAAVDERQFQVFDLYVVKGWPAAQVAETLGINVARVYLAKHRVASLLKKEVRRLEDAVEAFEQ